MSGGSVVLNNPTVTRSSTESAGGDSASFYGVGASVLTTAGTSYINGGTITSDAAGAAGAFSYADGVTYIGGTKIRTSGNTAGGIHAEILNRQRRDLLLAHLVDAGAVGED